MKVLVPLIAVLGLVSTPALADFASGPAVPATEAPAPAPTPVVQTPQLDACKAYCNFEPSLFGRNMATPDTISENCPSDSIARGGSTVYELVEGLDHAQER